MTDTQQACYAITRIFAQELSLQGFAKAENMPPTFELEYGWDWQFLNDETFFVILAARGNPTQDRPERISVSIVGEFKRIGVPDALPLQTFVTLNAPNILMPYVREAVAGLTVRGSLGVLNMAPVNIINVMNRMSFSDATGTVALRNRPEIAAAFGMASDALGAGTKPALPAPE